MSALALYLPSCGPSNKELELEKPKIELEKANLELQERLKLEKKRSSYS